MKFPTPRGDYVVLDATELNRDWYLSGLEFQLLRFLVRTTGLSAGVPSSVVAETVMNHERELTAATRHLTKAVASFERLAGRALPEVPVLAPVDYEARLMDRLEGVNAEVLPYPQTAHELIVQRATRRRPPFNHTGSG